LHDLKEYFTQVNHLSTYLMIQLYRKVRSWKYRILSRLINYYSSYNDHISYIGLLYLCFLYIFSDLLPGIEEFLCNVLAKEKLSTYAEEQRQYYLERLDIIKLPPSIPPRPQC